MDKPDNKIVFVGPFGEHAGYSYMNRRFTSDLYSNGWDMGVETMRCNAEISTEEADFFNGLRKYNESGTPSLYHDIVSGGNSEIVKIVCWLPVPNIPPYKHNVAYTMMETRDIAPSMCEMVDTFYNSIWVPTEYYKNAFIEAGSKIPVNVVPVGIDESFTEMNVIDDPPLNYKTFIKGNKPCPAKPEGFVYLSLFRWTHRKGFDVLLKSFLKEFKDSDGVSLVIVSRHVASTFDQKVYDAVENDIRRFVEEFGSEDSAPIYWCSDNIPPSLMPSVYAVGDAFVIPSRGEGIGLPALEATRMGLPLIAPDHTGFSDYVTKDNAYVIDIDEWVVCNEQPEWSGWITNQFFGQYFPKFGDSVVEQTAMHMRHVMDNPEEAKEKNRKLNAVIDAKYTWDKSILAAEERLLDICQ